MEEVKLQLIPRDPEKPDVVTILLTDKHKLVLRLKFRQKLVECSLVEDATVVQSDAVKIKGDVVKRLLKKQVLKEAQKIVGKDNKAKLIQAIEHALDELRKLFFEKKREIREKRRQKIKECYEKYKEEILKDPIAFAKELMSEHVGDDRAKEILLLALGSRYNKQGKMRISVIIQGAPSSGKSHLVKTFAKILPSNFYYDLSRITPRALDYLPELLGTSNVDGVIFIITEFQGVDSNYTIRILITEGKFEILTLMHDRKGRLIPRYLVLEGFPIFITTTTKTEGLDVQILTRAVVVPVDESPELTAEVVKHIVHKDFTYERELKEKIIAFKYFLKHELEPLYVRLDEGAKQELEDFLLQLEWTTYLRRIADLTRSLVEARALLFQHSRKRDGDVIYATKEDVEAVKHLVGRLFRIQVRGISPREHEIISRIREVLANKPDGMTYHELQRELAKRGVSLSYDYVRRIVNEHDGVFWYVVRDRRPHRVMLIEEGYRD